MLSALPRSPSNVRVSDVTPTSVRLSWSYDGDVQSEVCIKSLRLIIISHQWFQTRSSIMSSSTNLKPLHGTIKKSAEPSQTSMTSEDSGEGKLIFWEESTLWSIIELFWIPSWKSKEGAFINDSQFQIFSPKSLNNYPRIKSYWLV